MNNEALRESLIQQAELNFLALASEIDHILDAVGFYLDRYPGDGSIGYLLQTEDLKRTVDNIGDLTRQLAETITIWKMGSERLLSRTGTELNVINELWANVTALMYFLISKDISLDPFDTQKATDYLANIIRCNRFLT